VLLVIPIGVRLETVSTFQTLPTTDQNNMVLVALPDPFYPFYQLNPTVLL